MLDVILIDVETLFLKELDKSLDEFGDLLIVVDVEPENEVHGTIACD